MGKLIKDNKCFEEGASKAEVEEIKNQLDSKIEETNNQLENKIDKADGHISAIGWDDSSWVPYARVDGNDATFFLASSDNNALKFNWTGEKMQVIVNNIIIGYMSITE